MRTKEQILSEIQEFGNLFDAARPGEYVNADDPELMQSAKEYYGDQIFWLYAELGALEKVPTDARVEGAFDKFDS